MSQTDEDFEDLPLDPENENEDEQRNQNEIKAEQGENVVVGQLEETGEGEGEAEEIGEGEREVEEIGEAEGEIQETTEELEEPGEGDRLPQEKGEEEKQPDQAQREGGAAEEEIKKVISAIEEDEQSADTTIREDSIRDVKEDDDEKLIKTEKMDETEDDLTQVLEEEEEEEEEDLSYYNPDDFLSEPHISRNGTLPMNILEFDFLYGYNCRKTFNLVVLEENTLVFATGNFMVFFDVVTKEMKFRRSYLGGGIGHIRKNHNYPHFAVAESGRHPVIIIYRWPDLAIVSLLRGGASKIYTNLDYSPDGELLVSQGGEPDFLITIWNWREHKILLRSKSYVHEVFRVKFSPYVEGQLTSCGLTHIKFWKMARTFTGLKLQGELGRFGKTEYTDIFGVLPMPDEKVISGCHWGNMLVWDAGLIVLEVFRTSRRTCHDAPIVQFYYDDKEGELWSVSMDGHVRIWWYEKIDQADPPDDDRIVQIDPSYDFYTPGVMLMCIEKRLPQDPMDSFYYAQDGNGGIWLLDLNTEGEPKPSVQLYKCHGGKVVDMVACPYGPYVVTLGKDGRLYFFDYIKKQRILEYEFPAKGTCLIWVPLKIARTGDVLLAGFDDGQLRVCGLKFTEEYHPVVTLKIFKPHNKPITKMSINPGGSVLVTGSENKTIFIFKIEVSEEEALLFLTPIGYFPSPDVVTCITWHPKKDLTVLVGCMQGYMMEVKVPCERQDYTTKSFLLTLDPKYNQFKTYKSQIQRNIKLKHIEARKTKKLKKKLKELQKVKQDNPGLEIDEDAFLADSESEEELEPLYIPETPNRILWLMYTEDDTIWLSMAGYDAGYIYEYSINQKTDAPQRFKMIDDADDTEISNYVYSNRKKYLVFAMQDGSIRVNRVKRNDFRDLSDYWMLSMHDNQKGYISQMCFSHDEKYFFSCGHDGNIFAYKFHPEEGYKYPRYTPVVYIERFPVCIRDIDTYAKLSLEELKIKAENDRVQKLANEHKTQIREILKTLKERYARVLARNAKLLPSQIIPKEDLELDRRVTEDVDSKLKSKLELVKRKLAFDVEKSEIQMKKLLEYYILPMDKVPSTLKAINNQNLYVMGLRQSVMTREFLDMMDIIEQKLIEEQSKGRPPERIQPPPKIPPSKVLKPSGLEYFLLSLSPSVLERNLEPKLTRLLEKYRKRRVKWEKRMEMWTDFQIKKPVEGKNHPDDEKLLLEAKETIGDYKLKESDSYKVPRHLRETTVSKYKELLDVTLQLYNYRHEFIQKICDLREEKYSVREYLIESRNVILKMHEEMPKKMHKIGPNIPEYDESEFPEKNFEPNVILPSDITEPVEVDVKLIVEEPKVDQHMRELLPQRPDFPKYEKGFFHNSYDPEVTKSCLESNHESLLFYTEETDTPTEMDLRVRRLNRVVFQQDSIINRMKQEILDFNNKIEETKKRRLPLLVGGNFLDLFILTLNQELNILKQSEDNEERLVNKVNSNLQLVLQMEDILDNLNSDQEELEFSIDNYRLEETKIQDHFRHATDSNKFYDFLKKVFKKKFKPPKQARDDDETSSSSSSSSSSSEDIDDTASLDSRDFGIIKQDLNTCPKACEQAIFNLTLELRAKRHEIEQVVAEQNKKLETVKKSIELNKRKFNVLKNQLEISRTELETFQREKQRKLNQVTCVAVLKLDQMYGFDPAKTEISDLLVFSKTKLSTLYKRVTVLQHETLEQKGKLDAYHKHLSRMKKDILYMERKILELKNEIKATMQIKFGTVIDINEIEEAIIKKSFQKTQANELEEVMLKKMVFDIRMRTTDVKKVYMKELCQWLTSISNAQKEASDIIQENTKKLELLRVLSREKQQLVEIIDNQSRKEEFLEKNQQRYQQFLVDIAKLENIVQDQCKQLQELRCEIRVLKTKGLPPKATVMEQMKREMEGIERMEYDEYLVVKSEEEEVELFTAEITMPTFYPTESEDLVRELLKTLTENVDKKLSEVPSKDDLLKNILTGIQKCTSMDDIMEEILSNITFEVSKQQLAAIKSSAQQLFAIQEVSEDSFTKCALEQLEDIIDKVLLTEHQADEEVISKMVEKLVESIPHEVLMEEKSLKMISKKVESLIEKEEFKPEELKKCLEKIPSYYKKEMEEIINVILEQVFGKGMDYMYVMKY